MDGIRMILVGPNAGKDITLHGFDFKGGTLVLPPRGSAAAQRILTRYYSAYPAGSLEGEKAQADWERSRTGGSADVGQSTGPVVGGAPSMAQVKALTEARAEVEQQLDAERAETERLKAELRTEREAKKAAEAKLAEAAKAKKAAEAKLAEAAKAPAAAEEPPASKAKGKAE
ncbi:hypothetical protein [Myxococcus sp. CA040A]|uniref:hypothetical protein n=1 Tax=Myxococcus sp. CA040A TaxID=2741738 RepID=UPI00157A2798|nr:hypothetical protein [Myxococcus sp. CA040A]NTX07065.1 hypothetical protein [Myxococcus sp. CA040A]